MTAHTDQREAGPRVVLRALAALVALGVLVVAVPFVLVALTQALPLDLGALSPAAWGRADDGRLLLLAIVAVAWIAWAVMVVSVGLETWAAVRRVPTPTLPGMAVPQRMAAFLVASILVALSPAAGGPAVATGGATAGPSAGVAGAGVTGLVSMSGTGPGVGSPVRGDGAGHAEGRPSGTSGLLVPSASGGLAAVVAAASVGADRVDLDELRAHARASRSGGQSLDDSTGRTAASTVTTQRHDTLWMLAEQYLGAGERYVEIVELNEGAEQPDGRSLGDDGRIYPGWTLTLPADAAVDAARPERHVVVPGDTLWGIAADELGDPTRYPEIVEANRGDLQPDGRRLADPDLILPGWVVEIPGIEDSTSLAGTDPQDPAAEAGAGAVPGAEVGSEAAVAPGDGAPVPSPTATDMVPDPDSADRNPGLDDAGSTAESPTPVASGSTTGTTPSAMAPIDRAPSPSDSWTSTPAEATPTAGPSSHSPGLPTLDRGTVGLTTGEAAPEGGTTDSDGARHVDKSGAPATAPGVPDVDTPTRDLGSVPAADPSPAGPTRADPTPANGELGGDNAATGSTAITLPTGGAVAALVLAGVGAELLRRRRQFQRHRRPGERMPDSGPGARQVERAARTAGREPGLDLLDRALIQLAEEAVAGGHALPDVRLVRVSAESVVLDLAAPAGPPVAPFVAADETRWVLSSALLAAELPDRPRALGGLVTLGFSGPETVLLNLESAGTLAVQGPAEVTGEVLRGLAADLAFGPSSALTERTLCLSDPAIADGVEAGGIGVECDPVRATAMLAAVLAAHAGHPAPASADPAGDPLAGDPLAGDPLVIVLCDRELAVRVPPGSGAALITSAPVAGAGATLVVGESGMAVLLPEREHLVPQHLSRTATRDIVEALSAADLPEADASEALSPLRVPEAAAHPEELREGADSGTGQASLWESLVPPSEVIDLRENASIPGVEADPRPPDDRRVLPVTLDLLARTDEGPAPDPSATGGRIVSDSESTSESDSRGDSGCDSWGDSEEPASAAGTAGHAPPHPASAVPRVLVLGEVLVVNAHGRCESTRIGRLAETAAFVLLNPGSRPSALQGALWPGRRSNPQTCRQMISRARTWLGRTDAGEPYLMTFAESGGRLRLRDEVGSDWADFQRLAELGLADPEDTEHLTAALALVRGRPFGAVASRELPWADLHINEMISLISDVAHELAVRHERHGRQSAARDAALRGLRTESESEILEAIVSRTAV